MDHNKPEIPAYIYDWLEVYEFSELNKDQQEKVSQYLSDAEYNDLYRTMQMIRLTSKPSLAAPDKEKHKTSLTEQFKQKHKNEGAGRARSFIPVTVWQAAAVVLFVTSSVLAYRLFNIPNTEVLANARTVSDTLYITKEVPAPTVTRHDTVYITAKGNGNTQTNAQQKGKSVAADVLPSKQHVIYSNSDINIVSVQQIENLSNTNKGNNMKNDTLGKKYGFVSL